MLGQVLEAVDNDFNTLLELGFRSSIQKEWAWRVARGESLNNLRAFEHLIDDWTTESRRTLRERILAWETPRWCCSATARANGTR